MSLTYCVIIRMSPTRILFLTKIFFRHILSLLWQHDACNMTWFMLLVFSSTKLTPVHCDLILASPSRLDQFAAVICSPYRSPVARVETIKNGLFCRVPRLANEFVREKKSAGPVYGLLSHSEENSKVVRCSAILPRLSHRPMMLPCVARLWSVLYRLLYTFILLRVCMISVGEMMFFVLQRSTKNIISRSQSQWIKTTP